MAFQIVCDWCGRVISTIGEPHEQKEGAAIKIKTKRFWGMIRTEMEEHICELCYGDFIRKCRRARNDK